VDISVICPVFNTDPALLQAAARSVLDQPGTHIHELIIVDDGSTAPATLAMIATLAAADPRVVALKTARNGGPASARNCGLRQARGEWIGFVDADDLWIQDRVIHSDAVARAAPEAVWIVCKYFNMLGDAMEPSDYMLQRAAAGERITPECRRLETPDLTRVLSADTMLTPGVCLIRKALLQEVGGFAEGLFYGEDYLLALRLSVRARLHFLERHLYAWRREVSGLTSSSRRLGASYARAHDLAARDPSLAGFAKEIRWSRYNIWKGLAINNLAMGNRARALSYAARAWSIAPSGVADFLLFLRLLFADERQRSAQWKRYSRTERVAISPAA
jgi:glycosyltransferase involved in cell wall biosynthesis